MPWIFGVLVFVAVAILVLALVANSVDEDELDETRHPGDAHADMLDQSQAAVERAGSRRFVVETAEDQRLEPRSTRWGLVVFGVVALTVGAFLFLGWLMSVAFGVADGYPLVLLGAVALVLGGLGVIGAGWRRR